MLYPLHLPPSISDILLEMGSTRWGRDLCSVVCSVPSIGCQSRELQGDTFPTIGVQLGPLLQVVKREGASVAELRAMSPSSSSDVVLASLVVEQGAIILGLLKAVFSALNMMVSIRFSADLIW